MRHVAVIGGGLAGLTAALRLAPTHRVTLLEAQPRLGGQIWTETGSGFVIERGAEGFVARSDAVPRLAGELGLQDELVAQSVTTSYGFDGALSRLLPGEAARFLGFQVPQRDLGKGIRTFRRGMGSLIEACAGRLREVAQVRVETPVEGLRCGEGGVTLQLRQGVLRADAVVVGTSAAASAPLVAPQAGAAAEPLARASTLCSVTVELAFEQRAVDHPLDGTGFVVAAGHQHHGLRACTFTSSKFGGRAPQDMVSLRLFFRPTPAELERLQDADWQARACEGLARVLGVQRAPVHAWVTRWSSALPVFDDAHRAAVAAVEEALAPYPIALAGAAFHGSGIDAAVCSGERAAERLRQRLEAAAPLPGE